MYDITNILANSNNTQIFYPLSGSNAWQTWQKPPTAKLIEIFCLGAGGAGGAGGNTGGQVTNNNGAGGSGGAGAGYVKAIFPAYLLPDTLYIRAGIGGAGSVTSSGQPGQVSFVSIGPTGSTAHYYPILVASSLTVAGGGDMSTGVNNSAVAAVASGATTTAVAPFLSTAIFTATAGVASAIQSVLGSGSSQTALATSLVTAGANGASLGPPGTGGSIFSASILLTQTVQGIGPTSNSGSALQAPSGYGLLYPFCGTGGAGGSCGSSTPVQGGTDSGSNGGNGWYGCGGGGGGTGGNSRFGSTGKRGRGGNGGDGLVMITVIT